MSKEEPFADVEYEPNPAWSMATAQHVDLWKPKKKAWWFERLFAKIFPPKVGSKRWNRLNGMAGKQVECDVDDEFKELLIGIHQAGPRNNGTSISTDA